MRTTLEQGNRSRNLAIHSAYGFSDPNQVVVAADARLSDVLPLPSGYTIREYFDGTDVVAFKMPISILVGVAELQGQILVGLEGLLDAISNYSNIVNEGEEDERKGLSEEISATLAFWNPGLLQQANRALEGLQSGEFYRGSESIVLPW